MDLAGNVGVATDVAVNVIPDPLTTVVGVVLDPEGMPVDGASVSTVGGRSGTTGPDGSFSIPEVPTILGDIVVNASVIIDDVFFSGSSSPVIAVSGGVTDVGTVALRETILVEDFEDGVLDQRISISTLRVPFFPNSNRGAGIKDVTNLGSTKAFGFGRSDCPFNCFNNYTSTLKITLDAPTFVSTISFRYMELFDNWGSNGTIFSDGVSLSGDRDFQGIPSNSRRPDTTFTEGVFHVNRLVTVIELHVVDITNLSEIHIDDLKIMGAGIDIRSR